MPWALSKVEALRDAQNKAQVLFDEVLAKKSSIRREFGGF
jgi:hypothetical protein